MYAKEGKKRSMARKELTKQQVKLLLPLTRNKCAMHKIGPSCEPYQLVCDDTFYGEFAHICAAEEGGERWVDSMSDDDSNGEENNRNGIKNIIVLCPNHHTIIDKKNNGYSIDRLREIKTQHEGQDAPVINNISEDAINNAVSVANATITNFNNNVGNGVQQVNSMNGSAPQVIISVAGDYYAFTPPEPASSTFPLEVNQLVQLPYSTQVVRLKMEWLSIPAMSGTQGVNFDNEYYCFQVGVRQYVIKSHDFASHLSNTRANTTLGTFIMNPGEILNLLLKIRLLTAEGIQEQSLIDEIRILSAEKPLRIVIATDDPYARAVPFGSLDAETAQCSNPIKLMFGGGAL